jgi:hypothetical protein
LTPRRDLEREVMGVKRQVGRQLVTAAQKHFEELTPAVWQDICQQLLVASVLLIAAEERDEAQRAPAEDPSVKMGMAPY